MVPSRRIITSIWKTLSSDPNRGIVAAPPRMPGMLGAVGAADTCPSNASRIDVPSPTDLRKRKASKKFDFPTPFAPSRRVRGLRSNVVSRKLLKLRMRTLVITVRFLHGYTKL